MTCSRRPWRSAWRSAGSAACSPSCRGRRPGRRTASVSTRRPPSGCTPRAGVPLHPSFVYEIAFHAVAFGLLWFWLRHRIDAPGETLTLYLAAYGVFRFLVEFVRGNEVVWAGLTRPQLFLLVTVPLLLARVAWQARRGVYRRHPSPVPVEVA